MNSCTTVGACEMIGEMIGIMPGIHVAQVWTGGVALMFLSIGLKKDSKQTS